MTAYVSLKKAVEATGLHPHTLRKYADRGDIPHYRIPNGDRRFDVSGFVRQKRVCVCYARVSQPKQKKDLAHQCELLQAKYPGGEHVRDIGSGLNFKRKGLRTILERAISGESITVVVTYKDRLARFGFDLIEWLLQRNGGEVVVLNKVDTSPVDELTRDLTAIITVFASRLHGLRGHKVKKDIAEAVRGTEGKAAAMDGRVSVDVQPSDRPEV